MFSLELECDKLELTGGMYHIANTPKFYTHLHFVDDATNMLFKILYNLGMATFFC